ncbi:hypothetical protein [Streptomyces sp. NPDC047315]|uniref:hypothetical protein n=1 Tax=Streptomyces sp. NPDC047315 TaxID=3155142 RepID=UPI0033DCEE2F
MRCAALFATDGAPAPAPAATALVVAGEIRRQNQCGSRSALVCSPSANGAAPAEDVVPHPPGARPPARHFGTGPRGFGEWFKE